MFTSHEIQVLLLFCGFLLIMIISGSRRPKTKRMTKADLIKVIDRLLDEK